MQSKKENIGRGDIIIQYALILVVCFFAFFINNHIIPADLMESRNLATAQEMVSTGNYLIPSMNGELRLEKPPLPTWIAAGVEHVIPGSLVAQRCVSGIMGTIMVLFLYLLTSHLTRNRDIGFVASLILATSFSVALMGRTASWDIYCHSFMLGAIYFMVLGFDTPGAQWKNFSLAGLFLGLSFLSKGPVSFYALLLPFLVSFLFIYKPGVRGKVVPLLVMVVICAIVSLWWTAYIFAFHQEVFGFVIQKESSAWLNHNVRPWYYYWKFPVETGVWALFLVTAMVYFFLTKRRENRREYKFFLVWLIASLILLSIIPEKKTRYLLPILVPSAGVIAFYISRCFKGLHHKWGKLIFRINAMVIVLILAAIPFAMYFMFYKDNVISVFMLILSVILSWGLAAYIFKSLFNKEGIQVLRTFGGIIFTMIMVEAFYLIPARHLFVNENRHSIRLLRDNNEVAGLQFFYNDKEDLRMELVYEANKIITPMNMNDTALIYTSTPFVFVSGQPVDSIFKNMDVEVDFIDKFDNNWKQPNSKRYNLSLVREVAIINSKKQKK